MLISSGALAATPLSEGGLRAQPAGSDRLVLLGVRGGPVVGGYAQTPSANMIVFRRSPMVVDAGYGVTLKLVEAGVPLRALRRVFITHQHSDHDLELRPLLYNAWTAGLASSVDVFGPEGLTALLRAYWRSNQYDLETRIADEGRPDLRDLVRSHEFHEGPVMNDAEVTVTALRNLH